MHESEYASVKTCQNISQLYSVIHIRGNWLILIRVKQKIKNRKKYSYAGNFMYSRTSLKYTLSFSVMIHLETEVWSKYREQWLHLRNGFSIYIYIHALLTNNRKSMLWFLCSIFVKGTFQYKMISIFYLWST